MHHIFAALSSGVNEIRIRPSSGPERTRKFDAKLHTLGRRLRWIFHISFVQNTRKRIFLFVLLRRKKMEFIMRASRQAKQSERRARTYAAEYTYGRHRWMDGWMHACVMLMAVPVRRCFFSHLHLQPKLATTTRRSSWYTWSGV
jgi:hypothetical protein